MSQIYVGNIIKVIATIDAAAGKVLVLVPIDPRTGTGVNCPIGSIAMGPDGALYQKTGAPATSGWVPAAVAV